MLSRLKKHSILYVEDEPEIQANITEYLQSYFGIVHVADNGKDALKLYQNHHPDVLLLDINLPFIDGLSVAKQIRQNDHAVKIIMLTAHTDQDKLLMATELKLTKYLIKPIAPRLFKEALSHLAQDLSSNPSDFLSLGDAYTWNIKEEILSYNNTPVSLTPKEHRLLKLFIDKKGTTVNYYDIMITVWDDAYDKDISINSVKNQVSLLRKKLPTERINSVYGEGYILM